MRFELNADYAALWSHLERGNDAVITLEHKVPSPGGALIRHEGVGRIKMGGGYIAIPVYTQPDFESRESFLRWCSRYNVEWFQPFLA